ncbi:hypothetical protein LUZ60_007789 [Juncus effusus]|nr:hypothetical protein LUZ60_007789 [Juncus effusus]
MATSGGDTAAILEKAKELDQLRKDQDDVFMEINKLHKKILSSPEMVEKSVDSMLHKLRQMYVHAKELSETEISVSNALSTMLDGLTQSGASATQRKKSETNEPKKKRKNDAEISRFTAAASVRSQLDQAANLKGEQVAARVTADDAEKDEWVIAKVMLFDKDSKEFEVLDEEPGDDEDSTMQKKYRLPMSRIIAFPKKNEPSIAQDFPHGRQVLAVYPGTTALYKATVVNTHRKRKSDDYMLEFDDDEEDGSLPQRSVPFYRVVALPEGHRQ